MQPLPQHYTDVVRKTLRFSSLMVIFALFTGVLYQESAKKMGYGDAPAGLHMEALLQLAVVHGHAFLITVVLPLAMIGALLLARLIGGAEVSPRATALLGRGYLHFGALALLLMLYKGYAILLGVRGGNKLADIDAGMFGGSTGLRHGLYGVIHVGMAFCLGYFAIALWHSLGKERMNQGE